MCHMPRSNSGSFAPPGWLQSAACALGLLQWLGVLVVMWRQPSFPLAVLTFCSFSLFQFCLHTLVERKPPVSKMSMVADFVRLKLQTKHDEQAAVTKPETSRPPATRHRRITPRPESPSSTE